MATGKKFHIHTFGCQMNVHDSEKIAGLLTAQGHAEADSYEDADVIVFNTCSIRQKAEQKFMSELGRLKAMKKQRPGLKVVAAGCIAQQMGDALFTRVAGVVDYVLGPQNIHALPGLLNSAAGMAIEDNPDIALMELPAMRKDRARAWVSIMYGCNNFCTYCIVPYTRGRERSRPSTSIIAEIARLGHDGCREVTLLGQNVNSYTSDLDFPGLLAAIDGVGGIERVRFVTSHPRDLSDALIDAIAGLPKVCEHLHLPMQSGSTRVLGLMHRGYAAEQYLDKIERLRARVPGIAITTDVIAGFPTETDADHEDTMRMLRTVRFDGIFAFKYSPRPGTKAATMDGQIDESVSGARLNEILTLQDAITLEINQPHVGATLEVLVEGQSETNPEMLTGRTRTNKVVNFPGEASMIDRLVTVEIVRARRHSMDGRVLTLL